MKFIDENIPQFLLKRCFNLDNFSVFSLPDINNKFEYDYLWENILRLNISNFIRIYNPKYGTELITFDNNENAFYLENVEIAKKEFISFIVNKLKNNLIVFFYIDNSSTSCGHLIIPGDINYM